MEGSQARREHRKGFPIAKMAGTHPSGVTGRGIWLSHGLQGLEQWEGRDWHKRTDQSGGVGQKPGNEEGAGI